MSKDGPPAPEAASPQPRVIGTAGGLAIVIGSMLGIGIFLTPPQVATHLPSPTLYLGAWLAGGLIAFSGAVAYAELGTRFPKAGGDYVFLREAFGSSVSFAAGWVLFAGVFAGSVATMAVPLAQFQLPVLLAPVVAVTPEHVLLSAGPIEMTVARAVAVGFIVVLTAINVLGTRLSTRTQIALTAAPMVLLALGASFLLSTTEPAAAAAQPSPDASGFVRFGRAVLAIYFAYAGWNAIAYVGGEMKQPEVTVPRSLLGGTVVVTALYLLMAAAFLVVLGVDGLQGSFEAGTATATAAGGTWAAYAVTALIATALLGSLNGTVLAGGRVGWAMARSGANLAGFGRLNDRFRTPDRALLMQGALAIVFVSTGTFEILLELTSVAMLLMGALTVLALFRIRKRDGPTAPYTATLYPWLPLLFVATSAAVIGATLYRALWTDEGMTLQSVYPLLGVAIFCAAWLGHRLARGRDIRGR
jgi:basic amino acid/polyamine antiporter, APA family